jgi:hypothetical protein
MTMIVGAVLLILGLASGALLTAAPFGLGLPEPGLVTWVLFPALTVGGYLFAILGVPPGAIAPLSRVAGAALVLLALLATIGIFVVASSLVNVERTTLSLWYVLAVGFTVGPFGLWFRRPDAEAA